MMIKATAEDIFSGRSHIYIALKWILFSSTYRWASLPLGPVCPEKGILLPIGCAAHMGSKNPEEVTLRGFFMFTGVLP